MTFRALGRNHNASTPSQCFVSIPHSASVSSCQFSVELCSAWMPAEENNFLRIFPAISLVTLHCITLNYNYLYKNIDNLYPYLRKQFEKAFGSSYWCECFNVPMVKTIGLWHAFTRCSLAALARETITSNLSPLRSFLGKKAVLIILANVKDRLCD